MRLSARQIGALAPAFLFLAGAGVAAADNKSAVDAYNAGNYAAAVAEWRALADRGNAEAQFNLGRAYQMGRGVPADLGVALSWYEKAAMQGHPHAQALVGVILFQNGERARAIPWLEKGAATGDPRPQYVLGTTLFNGDVVKRDWPRAYALMTLAAGKGLAPAATNLAAMDKIIPLAQRQQGLALAAKLERGAAATRTASVQVPAVRPTPPAPNASLASAPPAARPVKAAPPAAHPPKPTPAVAAARPAAGGGWRVQLGAFSTAANAKKQWEALRARGGAFAGLQPVLTQAGPVMRLQAAGLPSRAAAEKLCQAAKAAGSACFPVAP